MYKVITATIDTTGIQQAIKQINEMNGTIENTIRTNVRVYFIVKVFEKTEKSNRKKGDE